MYMYKLFLPIGISEIALIEESPSYHLMQLCVVAELMPQSARNGSHDIYGSTEMAFQH